nr:hypothetical protein [Tanacetum cinerariifolium]
WCPQSPISQYLSPRVIANEGYNLKNCVANLISHGGWSWPLAWLRKAPNLGIVPVATLEDSRLDTPQWRDSNGKFSTFSVKVAWDALRQRGTDIAKITRKLDKNGHEKGKSTQEPGFFNQSTSTTRDDTLAILSTLIG